MEDVGVLGSSGTVWGHFLSLTAAWGAPDQLWCVDEVRDRIDGPALDDGVLEALSVRGATPTSMFSIRDGSPVSGTASTWAPRFAPDLAKGSMEAVQTELLEPLEALVEVDDQGEYEVRHARIGEAFRRWDARLSDQRYVDGNELRLADLLLFAVLVRQDPVYYELHKASFGLLRDFPHLENYARDLYEEAAFASATDFETMKLVSQRSRPRLNPRGLVPLGGLPDLEAPHDRAHRFAREDRRSKGTEESARAGRTKGEWVRPASRLRSWIGSEDGAFPPEAGRYHLYAPYNCPWSHRALLGRAVKGLQDVVGASIVYFRRDPDRGWQFNPAIPGCTPDLVGGRDFVAELYQAVGSEERSVPVLWDTRTDTIVSNESADILRMFDGAFGELATRDVVLVPPDKESEIDLLNELVYQRVNNGAYKAGFAQSQVAYARAYARYFRMIDWLEERLRTRPWLADTEAPSEADLRLFPTIFRHDAVYYSRFRLNRSRIRDHRQLSSWLRRMSKWPGVAEASNLDHARNGYFGRTGNGIVPAGPIPLGLSPKDFSAAAWRR